MLNKPPKELKFFKSQIEIVRGSFNVTNPRFFHEEVKPIVEEAEKELRKALEDLQEENLKQLFEYLHQFYFVIYSKCFTISKKYIQDKRENNDNRNN